MILRKPGGRAGCVTLSLHKVIDFLAEGGIGQNALKLVPGDGLKNDPRVLREVPEHRIEPLPYLVGLMVPRPPHVQSKLCKGLETLDLNGEKCVYGTADPF